MKPKQLLLLLFVAITINGFSQKIKGTILSFKYQGQSYQVYTGAKISLGKGLNPDGSFECASREKVLRRSETYSTRSGYQSGTNTDIRTGEKEYLGKHYAMGVVTVSKVSYVKKLDEYRITLGTPEGSYNFYLMHAIKSGEVTAINGNALPQLATATVSGEGTAQTYQVGAAYAVKLKNGSSVSGILREVNGNALKIETADKNLVVFNTDDIADIKKANDGTTAGSTINGSDFEILPNSTGPGDTTPLGCFANYTDLGFMLLNKLDKTHAGNYGFRLSNSSGYLFKNIFFLGGEIGYNGSFGDSTKYSIVSFGLNQRFFLLRKKKVSPYLNLYEKVGTRLKSESTNGGLAYVMGGDVGVNIYVGKKLCIAPHVGYAFHLLPKVLTETRFDGVFTWDIFKDRQAHYFVFGVTVGFRNL